MPGGELINEIHPRRIDRERTVDSRFYYLHMRAPLPRQEGQFAAMLFSALITHDFARDVVRDVATTEYFFGS